MQKRLSFKSAKAIRLLAIAIVCTWPPGVAGLPILAHAHVKWFIDAEHVTWDATMAFHLSDLAVQVWIGIIAAAIALAYLVDRVVWKPPQGLMVKGDHWHGRILYLFRLLIGISLIATAFKGAVLAPHLKEGANVALALRGIEALVGVLFISNTMVFYGAGLLFILFFASTAVFGLLMSLEYFNFLGIAIFLLIIKAPKTSWLSRQCIWALPLLRFHTGVALSVLAFSEKLFQPSLAMAFLAKHDVNFMKALGFGWFSDHLFVLSAGSCELIFGLIFVLGFVTRINMISLAFFLIASNIYFFLLGKPTEGVLEIIGHSNLFSIAMMLMIYGAGRKIRLRPEGFYPIESIDRSVGRQVISNPPTPEPWCA